MTPNQKFILSKMLKGAFIARTPTAGRPYTLYDPEMRPIKRLRDRAFRSLKVVYKTTEVLKKDGNKFFINRPQITSLRESTWLRKKLENSLNNPV
jgi:hypothetical protein